jgi:Ca2+-binding EF-hand superfamily protein
MEAIRSIWASLTGSHSDYSNGESRAAFVRKLSDDEMEELRMLSGFDEKEIYRIQSAFYNYTTGSELMTKEAFMKIEWVDISPLKDRLCHVFGFDDKAEIDFQRFIEIVASFNSTGMGRREHKLRVAFVIQDIDGDGTITRPDVVEYINRVTGGGLSTEEVTAMSDHVLAEASSDPKGEKISYADFQRVMAPTDFHTKLHLPI